MKRWGLLAALLLGCSSETGQTVYVLVTPDAASDNAVAEATTEATAEASEPDVDAADEPDADSSDVGTVDSPAEADAPTCPVGMAMSPVGCYDEQPVNVADFNAWRGSPVPGTDWWCNGLPAEASADAGPVAFVPWCAAVLWCEQHDKTLCSISRWAQACQPIGADNAGGSLEWLSYTEAGMARVGDWSICGGVESVPLDALAAIRCCKEAQ